MCVAHEKVPCLSLLAIRITYLITRCEIGKLTWLFKGMSYTLSDYINGGRLTQRKSWIFKTFEEICEISGQPQSQRLAGCHPMPTSLV